MSNQCLASLQLFKKRRVALLRDDFRSDQRSVLVCPAEACTPELLNQLLALTGGIVCVAMSPSRVEGFMLGRMTRPETNTAQIQKETSLAFCISVDAREGITTGISTHDRALTLRLLGETPPNPRTLVTPGHIFPVEVRPGGVLVKNTLPEGAFDIVKISGFSDAAVFIDCLDSHGRYMDRASQDTLCEQHSIPAIELGSLTRYRLDTEQLVERVAVANLPTISGGELKTYVYRSTLNGGEHVALIKGAISPETPTLTRVQSEFTFGDVFGGPRGLSRSQIHESLQTIEHHGSGVFLYLRNSSTGALAEQLESLSSPPSRTRAEIMREYGLGAQILRDLGVKKIELLTNSQKDLVGLDSFGIEIVSQRPISNNCIN